VDLRDLERKREKRERWLGIEVAGLEKELKWGEREEGARV
jgi:hypothetical protein